jgi:hypothetical protein
MKPTRGNIAKTGLEDLRKSLFYQTELTRFVDEIGHANIWPKPPTFAVHVAKADVFYKGVWFAPEDHRNSTGFRQYRAGIAHETL